MRIIIEIDEQTRKEGAPGVAVTYPQTSNDESNTAADDAVPAVDAGSAAISDEYDDEPGVPGFVAENSTGDHNDAESAGPAPDED